MRPVTTLFQINGQPLLVPDEQVQLSCQDLDTAESGRDEQGFMHRIVARYKVPSWTFSYAQLTEQEKRYMESLFPESPSFTFTHPDIEDSTLTAQTQCYRAGYSLCWRNAVTGLWSDYRFTVVAC